MTQKLKTTNNFLPPCEKNKQKKFPVTHEVVVHQIIGQTVVPLKGLCQLVNKYITKRNAGYLSRPWLISLVIKLGSNRYIS